MRPWTGCNEADGRYVLIVDEIKRANLSKVFGELFFLLEYRNDAVTLPYSGESFSLPPNLYVIGTMNTSDRSIALVDFALRRRLGFVGFYPDPELRQLRAYLADHEKQEYGYVADMLVEVNRGIQDRDFHLGHSYFMLPDPESLTEERIARIWQYSILPYLEEYAYDAQIKVEDYEFERLRDRVLKKLGAEAESLTSPAAPLFDGISPSLSPASPPDLAPISE